MSKIQTQHGQPANYNETLPSLSDEDASSLNVDGRGILKVKQSENVSSADAKLIARTTIAFASGDNLTTEKTATITITDEDLHPDGLYILAVEKAAENTAGNMTLKIYDSVKIDGTNAKAKASDTSFLII